MTEPANTIRDLLIIGGGPGGTAAAFRARELGLAPLVIDHDDLMKRIRDYSKDKLILPGFGGGDTMAFPKGGELVTGMYFGPIDKDELCRTYKDLYTKHGIEHEIGIELTGLRGGGDGIYEVVTWDSVRKAERLFLTRNLVLALGHGVPRRFDIPGNTDGINFRLEDPANAIGHPVCVIGGGTSAAEAVIAFSNAKRAAGDESAVYWCYRGDRLPRVSHALAEAFFQAYVGNGNVRYYPKSEPMAVITGEDHREYLCMRIDRRSITGRPNEALLLEFPKEHCTACIGEDLPERLLADLGIPMVTGGQRSRKRLLVNRYLESCRPNVYLIGDLLSQAYFECDDFSADPETLREVKHRGNIKSAVRDGVLVAQIIVQRLQGKTDIDLTLEDAAGVPSAEEDPIQVQKTTIVRLTESGQLPVVTKTAVLVRVLPGGTPEEEFPLRKKDITTIGSKACHITLSGDSGLAPHHASVIHKPTGYYLADQDTPTGVFLKLAEGQNLPARPGDLVRLGRQFLLFDGEKGKYRLRHYDARGQEKGQHAIGQKVLVLGRDAPVVLDAGDSTLSRRHLAVAERAGGIVIKDLKSANGSYLRIVGERKLNHGEQFTLGGQTFLFSKNKDAVFDTGQHKARTPVPTPPRPQAEHPTAAQPVAGPAPVAAAQAQGPSVTFKSLGRTIAAQPGQTICDLAEHNGIPIRAECHSGICGSDPIRIISGAEHLSSRAGAQEAETLEDLCELDPKECRLACMTQIKGPVVVEIIQV